MIRREIAGASDLGRQTRVRSHRADMVRAQELVDTVWARLKSQEPADRPCGRCGSADDARCGNGLEKIYPTTAVRYGYMNFIGEFTHEPDMLFTCGGRVVVRSDRGIELGKQVSLTCSGCSHSVSRDQIRRYIENSGPEFLRLGAGHILREATANDLMENQHLVDAAPERIADCEQLSARCGLDLTIVASEHLLGGERIIFYFMADGRIDFRELVRQLAGEYHTRIEMRQVGARDEARLIADYETCGRECCCKNFLKTLRPVSMRMAKMQKATLDPSKVSGRCGRLKCCLRYEHESYEELEQRLPKPGRYIRTAHGEGVVVDRQILTQLVQFRTKEERLLTVAIEDVLETLDRGSPAPEGPRPDAAAPDIETASQAQTFDTPAPDESAVPGEPGPAPPPQDARKASPVEISESGRQQRPLDGEPQEPGAAQIGRQTRRRRRRSHRRRGGPQPGPDQQA